MDVTFTPAEEEAMKLAILRFKGDLQKKRTSDDPQDKALAEYYLKLVERIEDKLHISPTL